jgi:hypothetical protein
MRETRDAHSRFSNQNRIEPSSGDVQAHEFSRRSLAVFETNISDEHCGFTRRSGLRNNHACNNDAASPPPPPPA